MSNTYDYYVSAVNYNSDNTHIQELKVHKVENGKFDPSKSEKMTRPKVIDLMNSKKTFITIVKKSENEWKFGAVLEIFPVTTEYLKTKKDNSTKDNLENLPGF